MTDFTVSPSSTAPPSWRSHRRACLGISLGNKSEQGDKLRSIVEWMNGNFDSAVIGLSDTLYRWNDPNPNGGAAEERARVAGDQWLAENGEALAAFTIPFKIIRWDYWLQHPGLADELRQLKSLYDQGGQFRKAAEDDINSFTRRRQKAGDKVSPENCLGFILEELAAYSLMSRENPSLIKLYPGSGLRSDALLRQGVGATGLAGVPRVTLQISSASLPIAEPRHTAVFETKLAV